MPTTRQRLRAQMERRAAADKRIANLKLKIAHRKTVLKQRPKLAAYLAREFNLRYTSGYRSPEHNAAVGGVPNSWHTKGNPNEPGAIDMSGAPQDRLEALLWAQQHVPDLAEGLIHDVGSGLHLHLGGWGVANWDFPQRGYMKRWRAAKTKQRARRDDATKKIQQLEKELAKKPRAAKGMDVSSHQGTVNYKVAKAKGYEFVWIKATEGQDFTDPNFIANVQAAKAAGLKVGAYHFLRPRPGRTGDVEARWFHKALKSAGLGPGDLIPALDVEVTGLPVPATRVYAEQAWSELRRLIGDEPALYTFPAFLPSWPAPMKDAPLWIAHTGVDRPSIPKPWTGAAAWQWTFHGRPDGRARDVDLNRAGDIRRLNWR